MKKEYKKIMRDILQGKDLEMNLPEYANAYMRANYKYSLIHLVLNYYTIKEIQDDTNGIAKDEVLSATVEQIHKILEKTIFAEELASDYTEIVEHLHGLRDTLTNKMVILTAYTDALQIYEYVLNRIEYSVTGAEYPVEESELAARIFQYLFQDNDKMVVNSKIQMVTGQLPIRMTKNRFFDYLTDTLNIYNGSEKSSVDDFVDMLKSTALLELPEGFGEEYPAISGTIRVLQETAFKSLDFTTYNALMEQFAVATQYLTELVSNYLLVMEIVNDLYAALLALPYDQAQDEVVLVCAEMLKGLHTAFLTNGEIPETVDDGFMQIEGVQETLGEEIVQYESILFQVMMEQKDTISWIMLEKMFNSLERISKLMSNSLFVDLEREDGAEEIADSVYVTQKRDELVGLLTAFFANHPKEVNRAVMASLFSNMPVLFNSQQEVKDYIEYSLNHCSNAGELMACAKILNDMMEEE